MGGENLRLNVPGVSSRFGMVLRSKPAFRDATSKRRLMKQKIGLHRRLTAEPAAPADPRTQNRPRQPASINVTVITPDKLTEALDGKFGRVKSAAFWLFLEAQYG